MMRYSTALAITLSLIANRGVRADEPRPAKNEVVANSIGMKLVPIPAGDFLMGSPDTDKDALDDEKPQHKVKITKPFLLGQYHVTVGEFRQFIKDSGYKTVADRSGSIFRTIRPDGKLEVGKAGQNWENIGFPITDSHPVCCVDFEDCIEFCKWLSKKEGKRYRLPTEAEWEYACRAGTATRWSCGDNKDDLARHANIVYDTFPTYARSNGPKSVKRGWMFVAPVGQFQANPWKLYDMHGNLWQWCSDWYAEDYYKQSPASDPTGPVEGELRVIRGGTWMRGPLDCRSANRFALSGATSLWVGFRILCEQQEGKPERSDVKKRTDMDACTVAYLQANPKPVDLKKQTAKEASAFAYPGVRQIDAHNIGTIAMFNDATDEDLAKVDAWYRKQLTIAPDDRGGVLSANGRLQSLFEDGARPKMETHPAISRKNTTVTIATKTAELTLVVTLNRLEADRQTLISLTYIPERVKK